MPRSNSARPDILVLPPYIPNHNSASDPPAEHGGTRRESVSWDERINDPVFYHIIKPTLEGRDPDPSYLRRLSIISSSSAQPVINRRTKTSSDPPTPDSRTRKTSNRRHVTASSTLGTMGVTQPLTRKNLVALPGSTTTQARTNSWSVSSLKTDSSFFQKGNLHPRDPTPIEEEDEEWYQWRNAHLVQEEEEDDEEEESVHGIGSPVFEDPFRHYSPHVTSTPPPVHVRGVSEPPISPVSPQSSLGGRNLRTKPAKIYTSTGQKFACQKCDKTYMTPWHAKRHLTRNPDHTF